MKRASTKRKDDDDDDNDDDDESPTGKFITLGRDNASYDVNALALSRDGKTLAAAGWFGGSELYAFKISKRPSLIENVRRPADALRHIALSPDGSILYGASRSRITRTRLKGKGAALSPIDPSNEDEVHAIALNLDGTALAVAVGDALVLWDARSGEQLDMRRGAAISACEFGSDGKTIVGITGKGAIAILDATTLNRIAIVSTGDTGLGHLAVSSGDHDLVALASDNPKKPIRIFSLSQKKTLFTLEQHKEGGIAAIAFSRDGGRLASAGEDGHVRVWDLAKKKLLADVRGKQEAMSDVVFLDDGRVAAGGRDVSNGPPVYVWTI